MVETVQEHDFIELDYTGKLIDGTVFDTTLEKVAKDNKMETQGIKYGPAVICVGERQLLPGLDAQLKGKEVGKLYSLTLAPQDAFGKRDIKKMRIIPMGTFREHKMEPHPGLQIDVDGQMGIVTQVSGGRVIVNFNHPLAGREIVYEIEIHRKITDKKEQIKSYLNLSLKVPEEQISAEVEEEKAKVVLPISLPPPFLEAIGKKLSELTQLKEVIVEGKQDKK